MELEILKEKFYRLVAPSLPNEWDVEEALSGLTLDDAQQIEEIFAQIPAIWPVSHSLCFSYLSAAGPAEWAARMATCSSGTGRAAGRRSRPKAGEPRCWVGCRAGSNCVRRSPMISSR